jgi:hypothetical protein
VQWPVASSGLYGCSFANALRVSQCPQSTGGWAHAAACDVVGLSGYRGERHAAVCAPYGADLLGYHMLYTAIACAASVCNNR